MIQVKICHASCTEMPTIYMDGKISQKLPVDGLKWKKKKPKLTLKFIQNYDDG